MFYFNHQKKVVSAKRRKAGSHKSVTKTANPNPTILSEFPLLIFWSISLQSFFSSAFKKNIYFSPNYISCLLSFKNILRYLSLYKHICMNFMQFTHNTDEPSLWRRHNLKN